MSDEPANLGVMKLGGAVLTAEERLALLERRMEASERRQAQAIEAISEEMKRMHDRFNQRQDTLARELGERMIDNEERVGLLIQGLRNAVTAPE